MYALPPLQRTSGAGLQLAWREWNARAPGLPLVLLHGITGSSADWHPSALHVARRRVVALDARGHGASDWAADEAYAVDAHFADLATALDALAIERCVLCGFSMGGGTAIAAAACRPDLVAGVTVVDAYPYPVQSPGSAKIARWVAGQQDGRRFDPAIARKFDELLAAGVSTRADLTSMWRAIECPALVIRGEYSPVLPAETAAQMLRDLPHARLEMVEGVAHAIPLSKPNELARLLEQFAYQVEFPGRQAAPVSA